MTIKNFRDEYADCACSYENLNAIGEDLKHSPLKKRYNSLLESVLRSMKFMQCAFLRNFPKKEADFKKTIQMLQVNNDFSATVDLMREFPEICKGSEVHLLNFISYLWKNNNKIFVQNSADILSCFTIKSVCRFLFVNLEQFPEMSLIVGDLRHYTDAQKMKDEICLLMWAVSSEVKNPSLRQADFLKLFE